MVSSEDDESSAAQAFAMNVDGDGAIENGGVAYRDASDVGGGSLGVNENEKEECGNGEYPVVQWFVDNYKEPDVRRVMTITLLFVLE